ncbi:MAG: B12-binding domain-containing radical SAM protein, partial [Vicinamibacteraceae bacterium]
MKRVLLMYPPSGVYMRDDRCQAPVDGMSAQPNRSPLDLAYMAAVLENAGIECRISDFAAERAAWEDVRAGLKSFKPDLLLVSVTTPTLVRDLAACRLAKEMDPSTITVAKGAHFTPKDEEVLEGHPELDVVVRGESEHTLTEIATHRDWAQVLGISYRVNGELVRTADRPFIEVQD